MKKNEDKKLYKKHKKVYDKYIKVNDSLFKREQKLLDNKFKLSQKTTNKISAYDEMLHETHNKIRLNRNEFLNNVGLAHVPVEWIAFAAGKKAKKADAKSYQLYETHKKSYDVYIKKNDKIFQKEQKIIDAKAQAKHSYYAALTEIDLKLSKIDQDMTKNRSKFLEATGLEEVPVAWRKFDYKGKE